MPSNSPKRLRVFPSVYTQETGYVTLQDHRIANGGAKTKIWSSNGKCNDYMFSAPHLEGLANSQASAIPSQLNSIDFFPKRFGLTDFAFPKGKVKHQYTSVGKRILDERTSVPYGVSISDACLNNVRV